MDNPFGAGGKMSSLFDKGDKIVHDPEPPFEVEGTERSKSNLPNDPNELRNTNTQPISNTQPEVIGPTDKLLPDVVKTVKDPRAEERAAEIAKRRKVLDDQLAENRNKRQEILEEYGGLESNIPINSEYWNLKG